MKIGGLQKCSLIDYPGEISAVIFARGCNFRCLYCYNRELVLPEKYSPLIPEEEIFSFLEKRTGKLDAAAITGGEPCMQPELPDFLARVRGMGFKVKLDTNGSFPAVLERALPFVDYIAMDIKAPPGKYSEITGVDINIDDIKKSIRLVMDSGKTYEFRTTLPGGMLEDEDFRKIGEIVKGARRHYLQNMRFPEKSLVTGLKSCSGEEVECFRNVLEVFVGECGAR